MLQIVVFVPNDHVEPVKQAMFTAGAGKMGNYDSCCFQYQGIGQFRPLKGSDPFVGTIGEVEKASEVKLEMVCPEDKFQQVVQAIHDSHPYETPAYYGIKTVNI